MPMWSCSAPLATERMRHRFLDGNNPERSTADSRLSYLRGSALVAMERVEAFVGSIRSDEDYSPCFRTAQYGSILALVEDVECH